jgi:hypothetical protein
MRLHAGEPWPVWPDLRPDIDDGDRLVPAAPMRHRLTGQQFGVARLRRVGWLDQKGRVWLAVPPGARFDGGSLTPLLIDARED